MHPESADDNPSIPEWHIRELEYRIAKADKYPEAFITLEELRMELMSDEPHLHGEGDIKEPRTK